MKISELTKKLLELQEKYGDLEVFYDKEDDYDGKLGSADILLIEKEDNDRFKVWEMEDGCRCGSCYEWRKVKVPFVRIF